MPRCVAAAPRPADRWRRNRGAAAPYSKMTAPGLLESLNDENIERESVSDFGAMMILLIVGPASEAHRRHVCP